ncbi:hypothetical protein AX15_006496 [Amanita polypyramis BW_CC]|nr:hypothetical protein AX15_006496 [Amanita polypyramis BW_CC]
MSVYYYVDSPNPNLTCCICRSPFVDPTTTTTCSHTFCYECIVSALSHAPQCPIDRSPLSEEELGAADSIVRALVDELMVECIHREQGCNHTCQRQLLPSHLREECTYGDVQCREEGCTERMLRMNVDAHMEAVHKRKSQDVPSAEATDEEQPCPNLHCPQYRNGCPFTATEQEALDVHTMTCTYQGLKGFLEISTARHASLLEQNVLLRHRVSALETSVQILRREMEMVQRALGPWFRMDVSPTNQDVPNASNAPAGSFMSRRGTTSGTSDRDNVVPETTIPGTGRDVPNVAEPYFPPFEGEGAEASSSQLLDSWYRAANSPLGLGMGFPPMRAPASRPMYTPGSIVTIPHLSSVVAPLNLGTNLEGTLTGVRESVLALAAGVDSLGRRSEIALTNETLRFGEEMMSLRAGINGLRMQVHTMMMERNAQVTGHASMMGGDGLIPPRPFYPQPGPMSITKL